MIWVALSTFIFFESFCAVFSNGGAFRYQVSVTVSDDDNADSDATSMDIMCEHTGNPLAIVPGKIEPGEDGFQKGQTYTSDTIEMDFQMRSFNLDFKSDNMVSLSEVTLKDLESDKIIFKYHPGAARGHMKMDSRAAFGEKFYLPIFPVPAGHNTFAVSIKIGKCKQCFSLTRKIYVRYKTAAGEDKSACKLRPSKKDGIGFFHKIFDGAFEQGTKSFCYFRTTDVPVEIYLETVSQDGLGIEEFKVTYANGVYMGWKASIRDIQQWSSYLWLKRGDWIFELGKEGARRHHFYALPPGENAAKEYRLEIKVGDCKDCKSSAAYIQAYLGDKIDESKAACKIYGNGGGDMALNGEYSCNFWTDEMFNAITLATTDKDGVGLFEFKVFETDDNGDDPIFQWTNEDQRGHKSKKTHHALWVKKVVMDSQTFKWPILKPDPASEPEPDGAMGRLITSGQIVRRMKGSPPDDNGAPPLMTTPSPAEGPGAQLDQIGGDLGTPDTDYKVTIKVAKCDHCDSQADKISVFYLAYDGENTPETVAGCTLEGPFQKESLVSCSFTSGLVVTDLYLDTDDTDGVGMSQVKVEWSVNNGPLNLYFEYMAGPTLSRSSTTAMWVDQGVVERQHFQVQWPLQV